MSYDFEALHFGKLVVNDLIGIDLDVGYVFGMDVQESMMSLIHFAGTSIATIVL